MFCFQTLDHALHEEEKKHRHNVVSLFDAHRVVDEDFLRAKFPDRFD